MTINARPVPRRLAGLLVLAATAALLGACGGPTRGTDSAFWRNLYGDPDTTRPDSVGSTCCRHAGRDSNH